jgi:hypothetical protein
MILQLCVEELPQKIHDEPNGLANNDPIVRVAVIRMPLDPVAPPLEVLEYGRLVGVKSQPQDPDAIQCLLETHHRRILRDRFVIARVDQQSVCLAEALLEQKLDGVEEKEGCVFVGGSLRSVEVEIDADADGLNGVVQKGAHRLISCSE